MSQITKPGPLNPITTPEGMAVLDMALWIENVTQLLPVTGSGSPESVVGGRVNRFYTDTDNGDLYRKKDSDILGDTAKGWVLV